MSNRYWLDEGERGEAGTPAPKPLAGESVEEIAQELCPRSKAADHLSCRTRARISAALQAERARAERAEAALVTLGYDYANLLLSATKKEETNG